MASDVNASSFTERQVVTFHLGNDEFGADIMNVKEIVRVPEITKVPNAPTFIEGACNLRGNVLPIIDGRARLGMNRKDSDENSRVLVVDINGNATGVVVDNVSEVMRVSTLDIEEPPKIIRNVDSDYLNGVVKMDEGNRLIMLLDVIKAVYAEELGLDENKADADASTLKSSGSEEESGKDSIDEEQMVSFLLDNEEYAIGIMQVKEIIRVPEIVKVPNCESYVEGVVSIRNHILPIINLRTYFGLPKVEVTDHTRVLVVDMGNFAAGIMVDKVSEVLRVRKDIIEEPPKLSQQSGDQLKGVAKLKDGKRLILMLEPKKLISYEEFKNIGNNDHMESFEEDTVSIERQLLDEEQLVTFKIDQEEYGIKINAVQEINRMTEVTKVPRAPHFIDGIVNLRGNIIPALDLRKLFGLEDVERTDATRIVIVDENGKKTGIVVDSVSEVLRFEKTLIEPPPKILSSGVDSEYVDGVGKLNEGKRMILILNLDKVIKFNREAEFEDAVGEAKNTKTASKAKKASK